MIDDRPQHERVVGVQPERELLVARRLVDVGGRERRDVAVELRAVGLERAVVDEAVADVQVEDLIEGLPDRRGAWLSCARGGAATPGRPRRDGDT